MIYTGAKSLAYLSVPLFTVFKNTTIIAIAYAEKFTGHGSSVSPLMLLSFLMMVGSSVIAGWSQISDERGGLKSGEVGWQVAYGWMLANCVTTAAYSVGMRAVQRTAKFKDFDTVLYNNALALPVLIIASLFLEGDGWSAMLSPNTPPPSSGLINVIAISSVMSFFISYASSWCVRVTSSTTFSMVGALNKLPIAVVGMLVFDDATSMAQVVGVIVAFVAGLVYAQAKNLQNAASRPPVTKISAPNPDSLGPLGEEKAPLLNVAVFEQNGNGNGHGGVLSGKPKE
ncbi:GDP-mannose transporter into the lumen of the Golgi [Gonapodya sp. JEL0774]|nr:GDP-mannose transporter into the lumen of the Golgi [Gonapodya sp. JEL0774]